MYQIRYVAAGDEKVLTVQSYQEFKSAVETLKKLGRKVLRNSMCENCLCLGVTCNGEDNWVYNACVYKESA